LVLFQIVFQLTGFSVRISCTCTRLFSS